MMRRACSMWSTIVGAGIAGALSIATPAFAQAPLPTCPTGTPVVDNSGTFSPFNEFERLMFDLRAYFSPTGNGDSAPTLSRRAPMLVARCAGSTGALMTTH